MFLTSILLSCIYVLSILAVNVTSYTLIPNTKSNEREVSGIKKIVKSKYEWELDDEAMVSKSKFSIKPSVLISRCKEVVDNQIGLKNPEDLAEDFQFIFPYVGPLSKKEYLSAVGGFDLTAMFPKLGEGLYYDFRVDPYEHNRVWFTARMIAIHQGDGPFGKATGKTVDCPPQAISLTFNEQGKVTLYTGGYVMDKLVGNSGGLGGVFGILYSIGKPLPFPEARPWTKSWQFRAFSFVGNIASKFAKKKEDN